ncbi:rod shape-determining protein [Chryseotalea sanaruensis]|uniref:Cell shape-determining protein MreB n=1 Tax=Chryseotalea sanaruensis TaxID=2482724 RepID=A0A401UEK0_9BACT|nr:rod shape-determining protein [Chryseotalea sanaruensis]GCC53290.1 rod shape-determining protein [Chryseotalea sanaruensis]
MFPFGLHSAKSFAIDLGNTNTLLTDKDKILLSEPSYIVFNENHSIKAVGEEAYCIFEKSHHALHPVKPLRCGVIADYQSAGKMIRTLVDKVYGKNFLSRGFDTIITGVPFHTTMVERRAFKDTLDQFNPRKTHLLFEPLAAAIGMDMNICEPEGKFIVDIGGGITEMVVISLSGVAAFQSIKVAGDTFDEAIRDYFRREHNLLIGIRTAELVKKSIGGVYADVGIVPPSIFVKGKSLAEGIPMSVEVNYLELVHVLDKPFSEIENGIIQTLQHCPPELASDIYETGIHVTGGSALLKGLKQRLEKKISLPVHIDDNPLTSVSTGISKALRNPKKYQSVLIEA